MEQAMKIDLHFFLGANSASGFVSLFDEFYDPEDEWHCYILKGGPGTGKSGLMERIVELTPSLSHEIIHCSSDPDSLDGVIFPDKKVCIADGTAPHVSVSNTQKNSMWSNEDLHKGSPGPEKKTAKAFQRKPSR